MSEHDPDFEPFTLPYSPLTGVSLCDQLTAKISDAEATYGPDMTTWPPLLVERVKLANTRLSFMAGCNELAALREVERRERADRPPWADDGIDPEQP